MTEQTAEEVLTNEVIELAARAAGLSLVWDGDTPQVETLFRGHLPNFEAWAPAADDTQAFRLLCKLSMRLTERSGGAVREIEYTVNPETLDEEDRKVEIQWPHTPAATRLAITLAAADIQRAKEACPVDDDN